MMTNDGDLNISANDLAKFLINIIIAGEYQDTFTTNAIIKYNIVTKTGTIILINDEDEHLGEGKVDEMLMPLVSTPYRYRLGQ
ncbi:hypothetical protein AADZ91_06340 [Colwelliaceae bacterium 6441]